MGRQDLLSPDIFSGAKMVKNASAAGDPPGTLHAGGA